MGIEHSKHVFRVFILLAAVLLAVFIGRIAFVKITLPSFGLYGHYRADSVAENAAREIRHGGNEACGDCHDSEKEMHDEGPHAPVPCEDCHDALATHVRDGEKVADMTRVKSVTRLCARCHRRLAARREDFPQINIEEHVREQGEELTDEVCFECHSPHDPSP